MQIWVYLLTVMLKSSLKSAGSPAGLPAPLSPSSSFNLCVLISHRISARVIRLHSLLLP